MATLLYLAVPVTVRDKVDCSCTLTSGISVNIQGKLGGILTNEVLVISVAPEDISLDEMHRVKLNVMTLFNIFYCTKGWFTPDAVWCVFVLYQKCMDIPNMDSKGPSSHQCSTFQCSQQK